MISHEQMLQPPATSTDLSPTNLSPPDPSPPSGVSSGPSENCPTSPPDKVLVADGGRVELISAEEEEAMMVEGLRQIFERAKSRTTGPSRRAASPLASALKPLPEVDPVDPEASRRHDETIRRAEMAERVRLCHARSNVPARFRCAGTGDGSAIQVPPDCREKYQRARRALDMAAVEPGIYALIGQIGAGKSHMACGLVNRFCTEGRTARYLDAAEYIAGIRATWRSSESGAEQRFLADHVRFALLVIDEMTIRRDTPDENLILMRLIKRRDDEKRTTVLIGNYASKQEFAESIDARIAERIFQGGGVIVCDWPSLRGRILT